MNKKKKMLNVKTPYYVLESNVQKKTNLLLKFAIVFSITLLLVTLFLVFAFTEFKEPISVKLIAKIIKQFGLIISIPTTLLFLAADFLLLKLIKKNWILNMIRVIVLFIFTYLVSLMLSSYIIFNALLDSPVNS